MRIHAHGVAGLAVAETCVASLLAQPAAADLPTGGGGDSCGITFGHIQSGATTELLTAKITCVKNWAIGVEHHVTIQRNGTVLAVRHKYCNNDSTRPAITCYFDYSASDPAGSQTFQMLDQWVVLRGYGPDAAQYSYQNFSPAFNS